MKPEPQVFFFMPNIKNINSPEYITSKHTQEKNYDDISIEFTCDQMPFTSILYLPNYLLRLFYLNTTLSTFPVEETGAL
jgi:hypothetical protein